MDEKTDSDRFDEFARQSKAKCLWIQSSDLNLDASYYKAYILSTTLDHSPFHRHCSYYHRIDEGCFTWLCLW